MPRQPISAHWCGRLCAVPVTQCRQQGTTSSAQITKLTLQDISTPLESNACQLPSNRNYIGTSNGTDTEQPNTKPSPTQTQIPSTPPQTP
eukprot:8010390-Ditylum_brightwellii.AAC.1